MLHSPDAAMHVCSMQPVPQLNAGDNPDLVLTCYALIEVPVCGRGQSLVEIARLSEDGSRHHSAAASAQYRRADEQKHFIGNRSFHSIQALSQCSVVLVYLLESAVHQAESRFGLEPV